MMIMVISFLQILRALTRKSMMPPVSAQTFRRPHDQSCPFQQGYSGNCCGMVARKILRRLLLRTPTTAQSNSRS